MEVDGNISKYWTIGENPYLCIRYKTKESFVILIGGHNRMPDKVTG